MRPSSLKLRILYSLVLGVLCISVAGPETARADTLRTQIETLASEQGFEVSGADLIDDDHMAGVSSENTADRIDRLLANYNFVVTRDSRGRIARLTIVGMRVSPPVLVEPPAGHRTKGQTREHYVKAVVKGPNGRDLPVDVMVDTGASTLVFPRSLASPLGFSTDQLQSVQVQTANGMTEGLSAILRSVRVGDAESAGVAVTFVEDRLLGGKRLLGMSFLGRFRMTIDGGNGHLHLEKSGE